MPKNLWNFSVFEIALKLLRNNSSLRARGLRDGIAGSSGVSHRTAAAYLFYYLESGSDRQMIHCCDQCNRSFARESQLATHKSKHIRREHIPCTINGCKSTFATKGARVRHEKNVHGLQSADHIYLCQDCLSVFRSELDLEAHTSTHDMIIRCEAPGCHTTFSTKYALAKHRRNLHGEEARRKNHAFTEEDDHALLMALRSRGKSLGTYRWMEKSRPSSMHKAVHWQARVRRMLEKHDGKLPSC